MKKEDIEFIPNLDPEQDKKFFSNNEFVYGTGKLASIKNSQFLNLTEPGKFGAEI